MSRIRTRTVALDDIAIDKGGDGRTVTAYATVFETPAEVHDQDGHYQEQIGRAAFDRSIAHRGTRFGVFYNHGMTIHGTPSERHSMPLGVPLEVKADGRGLLTRTRYSRTPLADEVLEGIGTGAIRSQSFTGRMLRSDPGRGPHRSRAGSLTLVTRQEIALIEYGPTPLPVYEGADILGVRASTLSTVDSSLLELILANLAAGDAALDPIVAALCTTDQALDQAQAVIAQILGTANPDEPDDDALDLAGDPMRSAFLERLAGLATRLEAAPANRSGTPIDGPADSQDDSTAGDGDHSRPARRAQEVRAHLRKIGVLR